MDQGCNLPANTVKAGLDFGLKRCKLIGDQAMKEDKFSKTLDELATLLGEIAFYGSILVVTLSAIAFLVLT